MVDDLYGSEEYRTNQIASGVTLFLTSLAMAVVELELVPPEERTATALVKLTESVCTVLGQREFVTAESRSYAQSLLSQLSEAIQEFRPLFPPGGSHETP